MAIIRLDPFAAQVSMQGEDMHLHIPRRMREKVKEYGLLDKKFRYVIIVEEIMPVLTEIV